MTLTPSMMLPLGTIAPDFKLLDTISGMHYSLTELSSPKGTVIMFICNHCPFVRHVRDEILSLAKEYKEKGISFIAICSNDSITYPDDAPEKMGAMGKELEFPFPYLHDETQEVAKAYQAACTPDFYVFDGGLRCVYRGQLDNSRPGNANPVNGADLRAALDHLLSGTPIDPNQKASIGCNIKWKK
jgi:thiol-disulfide isomerase/thioredoxin